MFELFSPDGFMPHGHCFLWNPGLVWLHVISDLLITLAYITISVVLVHFVRKRKDVPLRPIFLWFGLFIVSCGGTHLVEAWNVYHAAYWLAGMGKAFTALVSLASAFALVRVLPEAFRLPSPEQLLKANAALRESEERYRTVVETAREMIMTVDLEGRFTAFNAAFETLTGWTRAEWIGRFFVEILHDEDVAACMETFEATLQGEARPSLLHRMRTRKGEWLVFETTTSPQYRDGRVIAVLGLARDVTARVRSEAALSESREWLRALFENALDAILVLDDTGRLVDANPAAVGLLGYAREELLALTAGEIIGVADQKALLERRHAFPELGRYSGEYWLRRKDGSACLAEFRSVANIVPGVHFAIVRDVTDRRRVEEERDRLSRRLVRLQEEERSSISRELHDEVGQLLTGLRLMIEHPPVEGGPYQREEKRRVVNEVIGRVRDISMSLRPPMLDELGVLPTLLWHVERFEKQTTLAVDFRHANLDRRFPPEIELTTVRVVQEALTNVAKHAGTTRARVEVWANQETLGARIEDDGRGFDVRAALLGHSSGLSGMRERCRLLRGHLSIESAPGNGAALLVELPLGDRPAAGAER
jgi:PAS domain S-box-containing protein